MNNVRTRWVGLLKSELGGMLAALGKHAKGVSVPGI